MDEADPNPVASAAGTSAPRGMLIRQWLRRLVLVAFGGLAGLLLAEFLLRFMGISYPQPYVPDPHLGTRLQPGFSGWFTREGRAFVRVNRQGFRDRDHARVAEPGVFRIAVLGDSYAEAVQVDVAETFWSVLEKQLNSQPGDRRVEVMNFGISGFGTAQELETLRHVVLPWEPDLVLLAFVSGNDVRNNSWELEPMRLRPFYRLQDGRLMLDVSFRQHPDFLKAQAASTRLKVSLINHSRLLQLFVEARNRAGRSSQENREAGLDDAIYTPPATDAWREAWQVTERLLLESDRVARAAGAEFVIVSLTNAAQVHPDAAQRDRVAAALGVEDLGYPERRLQSFARRSGVRVVCLADEMARKAARDRVWFHGFENTSRGQGHWNASGHRTAGQILARELKRLVSRTKAASMSAP